EIAERRKLDSKATDCRTYGGGAERAYLLGALGLVPPADVVREARMTAKLGDPQRQAFEETDQRVGEDSLRPGPAVDLPVEVAAEVDSLIELTERHPELLCELEENRTRRLAARAIWVGAERG